MKFELTYKTQSHKYGPDSTNVYLGSVRVAIIKYGFANSKTETKPWELVTLLPGFAYQTIKVRDKEEGVERINNRVKNWLGWTKLTPQSSEDSDK